MTTSSPTVAPTAADLSSEDNTISWPLSLLLTVAISLCVLLLCVICLFGICKRVKKNVSKDVAEDLELQMQSPSSQLSPAVGTYEHEQHEQVRAWLENVVHLPQYWDALRQNGYDSMKAVQQILDKSELEAMGILKAGHQALLLSEISILNLQTSSATEAKAGDAKSNSKSDDDKMYINKPTGTDGYDDEGIARAQTMGDSKSGYGKDTGGV